MAATNLSNAPATVFVPPGATASGARTVRQALGHLRRLAWIALVGGTLALIEAYLTWAGVFSNLPVPGEPFNLSWAQGVQLGVGVAAGLALIVLIVLGVVTALRGLFAWRRGVLAMVAAAAEFGPNQEAACRVARRDHGRTLWWILGIVLVAIVVGIAVAGINGSLAIVGLAALPGPASSVAVALATGLVLVVVYYVGGRHLAGLLTAIATPGEAELLDRGRRRMLAGAVIGLGGALSSLAWPLGLFGLVSLGVIIYGVRDLEQAYDLWLASHPSPPAPHGIPGPAPG